MAKINVEFDTRDKILNVTMDGKSMENVSSVEFFKGFEGEDFHGSITSIERIDDEDMTKIMRVSAKDGLTEIIHSSNLPKLLANKLFPARMV